jgi:hypothetical protein
MALIEVAKLFPANDGPVSIEALAKRTGMTRPKLKSTSFLKETCKAIAMIDGNNRLSDDELLRAYDVVPDSAPEYIHPKIATHILLEKDTIVRQHLEHYLRSRIMSGGSPITDISSSSSAQQPPVVVHTTETGTRISRDIKNGDEEIKIGSQSDLVNPNSQESLVESGAYILSNDIKDETYTMVHTEGVLEGIIGKLRMAMTTDHRLVNVTDIMKASGSSMRISHWRSLPWSSKCIEVLAAQLKITEDDILVIKKGGDSRLEQGTWAHPRLAIIIAQWISPVFAVHVSGLIERMMRGDLSLVNEVVERHDAINKTATNIISAAPAGPDQVRQTIIQSISVEDLKDNTTFWALNHKLEQINKMIASKPDLSNPRAHRVWVREDGVLTINSDFLDDHPERVLSLWNPDMYSADRVNDATPDDIIRWMAREIIEYKEAFDDPARAAAGQSTDAKEVDQLKKTVVQLTDRISRIVAAQKMLTALEAINPAMQLKKVEMSLNAIKLRAGRGDGSEVYQKLMSAIDAIQHNCAALAHVGSSIKALLTNAAPSYSDVEMTNMFLMSMIGPAASADMRNFTAVITDIANIFRADLSPLDLSNQSHSILADEEEKATGLRASYYTALERPIDGPMTDEDFRAQFDMADSNDGLDGMPDTTPSLDSYSIVSSASKLKKGSELTRRGVVQVAASLNDANRLAIIRYFAEHTNLGPTVHDPVDQHVLNIWIGQDGWATKVIPESKSSVLKMRVAITYGDIYDAIAYHLRPGGRIILDNALTGEAALQQIKAMRLASFALHSNGRMISFAVDAHDHPATESSDLDMSWHNMAIMRISAKLAPLALSAILPSNRCMTEWAIMPISAS